MGYAVGAATGVSDLLSAIQAFALSEGWTVDSGKAIRSDNSPTTPGECLNISNGDIHAAIYTQTTPGNQADPGYYLGIHTYPLYNGALGNMEQVYLSPNSYVNKLGQAGFVAHHLFGGPSYIHVVVEVTSGTFKHFGIGQVDKLGVLNDGVYAYTSRIHYDYKTDFFSSNHSFPFDYSPNCFDYGTIVRADCDGESPRYHHTRYLYSLPQTPLLCGGRLGHTPLYLPFSQTEVSELTGRTVLYPIMMIVGRGSGMYSPIGYVKDVRMCKMTNYNPGDALVIAGETWRLFPWVRKNGALGEETSLNFGYAYKQT